MRRNLVLSLVITIAVAVIALGLTLAVGNKPQLGLDLQGGASVVLQPKESVDSGVLDQAIEIIRNRVDALGVAEPEITRQGNSILVELPGVKDQDRALSLVGQTAELRVQADAAELAARRVDAGAHRERHARLDHHGGRGDDDGGECPGDGRCRKRGRCLDGGGRFDDGGGRFDDGGRAA